MKKTSKDTGNTEMTGLRLPVAVKQALQRQAKRDHRSLSAHIVMVLELDAHRIVAQEVVDGK